MTVEAEVRKLLDQLKARVPPSEEVERLTDEISVLVAAYAMPTVGDDWAKYGLTASELRLVELLNAKRGRIVTRSAMMNALYFDRNPDDEPEQKIVDVYICRIRKRLAGSDIVIDAVPGLGYRMAQVEVVMA